MMHFVYFCPLEQKFSDICAAKKNYTGCHKYVPIDQRLNFQAHRGYNLKRL